MCFIKVNHKIKSWISITSLVHYFTSPHCHIITTIMKQIIKSLFFLFLVVSYSPIYLFAGECEKVRITDVTSDLTYFHVTIANEGDCAVYLFSSYLKTYSPVFFRYDSLQDRYKFSYLPLIEFLTVGPPNDLIKLTPERPLIKGQYNYRFVELPPHDTISINLNVSNLRFGYLYLENEPKYGHPHSRNSIAFKKEQTPESVKEITIELAVYRDVNVLLPFGDGVERRTKTPTVAKPPFRFISHERIEIIAGNYQVLTYPVDISHLDLRKPLGADNFEIEILKKP